MDIKTAEKMMKDKKPVLFHGQPCAILEIIIWYDIHDNRRISLVVADEIRTTYRVNIESCEVNET